MFNIFSSIKKYLPQVGSAMSQGNVGSTLGNAIGGVVGGAAGRAAGQVIGNKVNSYLSPRSTIYSTPGSQRYGIPSKPTTTTASAWLPAFNKSSQPSRPNTSTMPSAPSAPNPGQTTTMGDLFDKANQSAEANKARQIGYNEAVYNENEANARQLYDTSASRLREQIPDLQSGFDRFKSGTEADIAALKDAAEKQKMLKAQQYDANQRTLMENRRQLKGDREKQYAGLGTIDSYGTGSFTQTNANDDTDFQRQTNNNLMQKQGVIDQIDFETSKAERDAQSRIADEEAKFSTAVRDINEKLADNETAKGQALRQAYLELQASKNAIQDQFEQTKTANEQQKMAYQQEMDKLNTPAVDPQLFEGLSDDFKNTGKIKTLNDMIFITKYPDAYKQFAKANTSDGTGKVAAKDANTATAGLNAIANIRSMIQGDPNLIGPRSLISNLNPLANQEYKATISNASDLIGRLRSGGAINAQEEQRFRGFLPGPTDNTDSAEYKLAQLSKEFNNLLGNSTLANNQTGLPATSRFTILPQ